VIVLLHSLPGLARRESGLGASAYERQSKMSSNCLKMQVFISCVPAISTSTEPLEVHGDFQGATRHHCLCEFVMFSVGCGVLAVYHRKTSPQDFWASYLHMLLGTRAVLALPQ
jgi:hypothetical protein